MDLSFGYSRLLRVPDSSTKPIQMKSTMIDIHLANYTLFQLGYDIYLLRVYNTNNNVQQKLFLQIFGPNFVNMCSRIVLEILPA